jgi:hypothetical protein
VQQAGRQAPRLLCPAPWQHTHPHRPLLPQALLEVQGPGALQRASRASLNFLGRLAVQPGLPPPRGPEAVGRLVLQSLGSLDWQAGTAAGEQQQAEQQLARLVLQLKLAVQGSRSAALITCHTGAAPWRACTAGTCPTAGAAPLHPECLHASRRPPALTGPACLPSPMGKPVPGSPSLQSPPGSPWPPLPSPLCQPPAGAFSESLAQRLVHLCDAVVRLEGAADDSPVVALLQGSQAAAALLHLHKLPSLGMLGPRLVDGQLHVVRHLRRRISVAPVEVDPDAGLGGGGARGAEAGGGGGGGGGGGQAAKLLCGGPAGASKSIDF